MGEKFMRPNHKKLSLISLVFSVIFLFSTAVSALELEDIHPPYTLKYGHLIGVDTNKDFYIAKAFVTKTQRGQYIYFEAFVKNMGFQKKFNILDQRRNRTFSPQYTQSMESLHSPGDWVLWIETTVDGLDRFFFKFETQILSYENEILEHGFDFQVEIEGHHFEEGDVRLHKASYLRD
jgi:hypothetical protein